MRTIPCGHQSLDFTCATCVEATTDCAKGIAWGVIPTPKTHEGETAKLRLSLNCVSATRQGGGTFCTWLKRPIEPDDCKGCFVYRRHLLPGFIDPLSDAPHPNPRHTNIEGWAHSPEQRQRHLEAMALIVAMPVIPPARQGRGIVTVGGGKFWPGIICGIRALRSIGCGLPVQIWHQGNEETDPNDLVGLGPVSLHCIDQIASNHGGDARTISGWPNKLYALTHTTLKEVLFLDADAYVVANPTPLFDQLKEAPFAYWQEMDFHNTDVKWEKVWPAGAAGIPPLQGGQLVIDTQEAWALLRLVHWICQHSDYYFAHMYGDQDAWRAGLSALNWLITGKNLGRANWDYPAFRCALADGVVRIVHRCQSKLFDFGLPMESTILRWWAECLEKRHAAA